MKIKTFVFAAVTAAALCAGVWCFISPSLNRQAYLKQQEDLLDSILAVMPAYAAVDTEMETQGPALSPTVSDDLEYAAEPIEDASTLEPIDQTDFPSGIVPIGILSIDKIGLQLPVMEGVNEPELQIAPGRVPHTAVIGEIGNAVITGHRNLAFGSMFNRLGEMENGNIIQFQAMDGKIMFFEVFEVLEITPDNQIAFIQPKNKSIITLYTCTPIREATHRLLVRAQKIGGI